LLMLKWTDQVKSKDGNNFIVTKFWFKKYIGEIPIIWDTYLRQRWLVSWLTGLRRWLITHCHWNGVCSYPTAVSILFSFFSNILS
jgi:hypothetical protein